MSTASPTRRQMLAGSAAAFGGLATGSVAQAGSTPNDTFTYEVTRSEEEWRERLTWLEYRIMRENGTEIRRSNPNWEETRDGTYQCRGCDLTLYESQWKTVLDIGWVFFHQSCPDAILMGIDGPNPDLSEAMPVAQNEAMIEAHCRRCGSHLGHILTVEGTTLHCINGTSLGFIPSEA